MEQQQRRALSPADWREALRQCVRSRSFHVLREQVLLVFVEPHATFHPLHALLPLDKTSHKQSAFVAVMRVHEQVTVLLRELKTSQLLHNSASADEGAIYRAVLENVVFVDRAVDGVSAKRANDTGGPVASAVSFFHPRQVNLSGGALRSFAKDEASAKVALGDITIAVQSCGEDEEEMDFLDAGGRLVVVAEHDEGYIGQVFDERVVSSIIRVKKVPFKPSDVSFDSVLEAYEEDFRYQMEINGVAEQPQQLAVRVQAGFNISSTQHQVSASVSSVSQDGPVGATLISSWSGLESIRSLYCKPPPNSSSLVCVGGISDDDSSLHRDSVLAHTSSVKSSEPFPVQIRQTIAFLGNLESSIHDSTFQWQSDVYAATSDMEEQSYLLRKFRRFLGDPDASQEDTIDLNNTMEFNMALSFERDDEQIKSRTDLDFLEKMWEFVRTNVTSTETAVTLVQEFVRTFAADRAIPLVHAMNPTRLGEFLRSRVDARRAAESGSDHSLQVQLSMPHQALLALFELGEWKLQRDIASWLAQIGFTGAESSLIVDQFQLQSAGESESHKPKHAAIRSLVDVCALAVSLGVPGSLLRKLANDCLGYFTRQKHLASSRSTTPAFVLPLNSFIPDRIRANLGDALFWDLDVSFGELMERKLRICESSFHHRCCPFKSEEAVGVAESKLPTGSSESTLALDSKTINQLHHHLREEMLLHPAVLSFVQRAERNEQEYELPPPVGLVQYECTVRKLRYFDA